MPRKKRQLNVKVTIVPFGILAPNPHNPCAKMTLEERRRSFTRIQGKALAKAARRRIQAAGGKAR